MNRFLIPLGIFIALVVFLAIGLTRDPKIVPSPLVDKPVPAFTLPQLHVPEKNFGPADMQGKVWLLNVWASWCVSCRAEHEVVTALVNDHGAEIVGLNYKDHRADAMEWLKHFGDPYALSVSDLDGRVGIDWGVYGVPETFVIDQAGIIRYKHIGPMTAESITEKVLPLLNELKAADA